MLDTEKIRKEVSELANDTRIWHSMREFGDLNNDEFTEVMKSKYEYLYSNSSTLFERSMKGDLNMQQLNFMLDMIEKVKTMNSEYNQKILIAETILGGFWKLKKNTFIAQK
jgi:hypothetical protein